MNPSTKTRNELIEYIVENDLVANPERMSWQNLYAVVSTHLAQMTDFDVTLRSFAWDARRNLEHAGNPARVFNLWTSYISEARQEFPFTKSIVECLDANADAYNKWFAVPEDVRDYSFFLALRSSAIDHVNSLIAAADVF